MEDALLRDARFIVGIRLHTQQMPLDEAIGFFVSEGYQTRSTGEIETKRGTSNPTYLYYTLGKLQMMSVARAEIGAGLRDADNRFAGLQLMPGQPVIQVALEVERGHSRVMRVVEPLAGTELALCDTGDRLVHCFSRTAHALFLCVMFVLAGNLGMSTARPQRFPGTAPPTTLIQRHSQKILVRRPTIKKMATALARWRRAFWREFYGVSANSRRAEVVWGL